MFSVVCLSVSLSTDRGPHVTITHDALDLTMLPHPWPPDMGPHCIGNPLPQIWNFTVQGPPASDIWSPILKVCTNVFTWGTDIWWLLKHVRLEGSTHLTGMFSWFVIVFSIISTHEIGERHYCHP